jgi:hypothetical protein
LAGNADALRLFDHRDERESPANHLQITSHPLAVPHALCRGGAPISSPRHAPPAAPAGAFAEVCVQDGGPLHMLECAMTPTQSRCEAPNKTCHSPLSVSYAGSSAILSSLQNCLRHCLRDTRCRQYLLVKTRRITVSGHREVIPVCLQGRVEACKVSNISR